MLADQISQLYSMHGFIVTALSNAATSTAIWSSNFTILPCPNQGACYRHTCIESDSLVLFFFSRNNALSYGWMNTNPKFLLFDC